MTPTLNIWKLDLTLHLPALHRARANRWPWCVTALSLRVFLKGGTSTSKSKLLTTVFLYYVIAKKQICRDMEFILKYLKISVLFLLRKYNVFSTRVRSFSGCRYWLVEEAMVLGFGRSAIKRTERTI